MGRPWGTLGTLLGQSLALLGRSWDGLERAWESLEMLAGLSSGALGLPLGRSWGEIQKIPKFLSNLGGKMEPQTETNKKNDVKPSQATCFQTCSFFHKFS